MDEHIPHVFDDEPTTNLPRQNSTGRNISQINIGGNARVHIGDGFQQPEPSTVTQGIPKSEKEREEIFIRLTAITIELIEHLLNLLHRSPDIGDHGTGPFIESIHLQLASNTIQRLVSLAKREQRNSGSKSPSLEETILEGVTRASVDVARDIQHTLDNTGAHQLATKYESITRVLEDASIDQDNEKVVMLLNELCSKAMLSLLIQLRNKEFGQYFYDTRLDRASVPIILDAVKVLFRQNNRKVSQLYRSTSRGWFSLRGPDALLSAAEAWRLENATLLSASISSMFSKFATTRATKIRSQTLSSLSFPDMDRRYHAITQAHVQTLNWAFHVNDNSESDKHSFPSWLQRDDAQSEKLFWISGKPGSGKSTLMRLLKDDERTRYLARVCSTERKLVVASCFFWSSGSPLQKSLQGLLQTLLHQMLSVSGDFFAKVVQSHWDKYALDVEYNQSWSIHELRSAIFRFAEVYSSEIRILVLVDGLDEFEGNNQQRQTNCDLLKRLSRYENVKVCVSSRPWNVYQDSFGTYPTLTLELLTRQDIQNYVEHVFRANHHYQKRLMSDPVTANEMAQTVVDRANGVFLWVRLVVRSLVEGLEHGDNVHHLLRRVRELPGDLEDYFHLMLSRLEQCHLEEASQMFEFALLEDMLLLNYCFMYEVGDPEATPATVRVLTEQEIIHELNITKRRINARCMGLLEHHEPDADDSLLGGTVSFLHRTAKDFIASPAIRDTLTSWRKYRWDSLTALSIARLRIIQSCDREVPWATPEYQFDLLFSVLQALPTLPQPTAIIGALSATKHHLNSLRPYIPAVLIFPRYSGPLFSLMQDKETDLLALATFEGANPYVLSVLQDLRTPDLLARRGRPLLDCALTPDPSVVPSLATVSRLLELGANPNQVWNGDSIWNRFFSHEVLPSYSLRDKQPDVCLQLIELLLLHGAPHTIRDCQREMKCKELFRVIFTSEEAEKLIAIMNKQKWLQFWTKITKSNSKPPKATTTVRMSFSPRPRT